MVKAVNVSYVYVDIFCTNQSGRLECNSQFVGQTDRQTDTDNRMQFNESLAFCNILRI